MSDTAQDQRGSAAHNVNLSPAVPDDDEYALTDSDLDGMTDAETEGLKEWLNPPDDGGEDGDGAPAGDAATTPGEAPSPEDKRAADPEPPAQAQREQDVSIDLAPKITAKRGELETLRANKKALMADWNDGEISEDDFNTRMSDMDQEIINLSSEIGSMSGMQSALSETKEAQQRAAQEAADQQWQTTVQAFQSKNPELWGKDHYKAFDATVRSVTANPAVAALPFEKQIEYAAEQYVSLQRALGKPVPTLNGEADTPDPRRSARSRSQARRAHAAADAGQYPQLVCRSAPEPARAPGAEDQHGDRSRCAGAAGGSDPRRHVRRGCGADRLNNRAGRRARPAHTFAPQDKDCHCDQA